MNIVFQRFLSIFLYTLPLSSSISLGSYLFSKYSFLFVLEYLTFPIVLVKNTLPYGSLLIFFIFFIFLVQNPKIPYFVRFNALQSLLLDIILIIFKYGVVIFQLEIIFKTASFELIIFVGFLSIFIFSCFQCIFGIEPEIPFLSNSVRMKI